MVKEVKITVKAEEIVRDFIMQDTKYDNWDSQDIDKLCMFFEYLAEKTEKKMSENIIGKKIEMAIIWKGWMNDDLADATGINPWHIGQFLLGVKTPNSQELIAIANALNISTNWLMSSLDHVNRIYTDYQNYGHAIKCPVCGTKLTSLLLCSKCGIRYKLTKLQKGNPMNKKDNFMQRFKAMGKEKQDSVIEAFCEMMHEPTAQELMDVFGRIIDDNNYLPGYHDVVVRMSTEDHDLIEKIYYWTQEELKD